MTLTDYRKKYPNINWDRLNPAAEFALAPEDVTAVLAEMQQAENARDEKRDDDDFCEGREPEQCAHCRGSGQYDDATPCPWCDGDGTEPW